MRQGSSHLLEIMRRVLGSVTSAYNQIIFHCVRLRSACHMCRSDPTRCPPPAGPGSTKLTDPVAIHFAFEAAKTVGAFAAAAFDRQLLQSRNT